MTKKRTKKKIQKWSASESTWHDNNEFSGIHAIAKVTAKNQTGECHRKGCFQRHSHLGHSSHQGDVNDSFIWQLFEYLRGEKKEAFPMRQTSFLGKNHQSPFSSQNPAAQLSHVPHFTKRGLAGALKGHTQGRRSTYINHGVAEAGIQTVILVFKRPGTELSHRCVGRSQIYAGLRDAAVAYCGPRKTTDNQTKLFVRSRNQRNYHKATEVI